MGCKNKWLLVGRGAWKLAAITAGYIVVSSSNARAAETILDAHSYWIGNTTADSAWTQSNITAIAATPDGRVFTNAPWDESSAEVSEYRAGKVVARALGTHGWGWNGGNAITVDDRYVYIACFADSENGSLKDASVWPPKGRQWFGVSRRLLSDPATVAPFRTDVNGAVDPHRALASAFLKINDTADTQPQDIGGLASDGKRLYVSNTSLNRIEIYDRDAMHRISTWSIPRPGRIALDKDGSAWVITGSGSDKPGLVHVSSSGAQLSDTPRLEERVKPADVVIDATGRLWIADNGPSQRLMRFSKATGRFVQDAGLGEEGGLLADPKGRTGPRRFNGFTGIASDGAGTLYVATNGIGVRPYQIGGGLGATLEAYGPSGARLWKDEGLLFVDGGWLDPSRPDSVYTGNKRFKVDLSDPSATSWEYVAYLSDRFRYPQDANVTFEPWPGSPIARLINGKLFLYLQDMYADHIRIYRFDAAHGETAIPSGLVATAPLDAAEVATASPGGEWIWRDLNGDGRFGRNEFERAPPGIRLLGGWSWWVDTKGNVWRTNDRKEIIEIPFGGIDVRGNPVYSYARATRFADPAPFTEVRRAIYDADNDAMYVVGYTSEKPFDRQYWKEAGPVLARYDAWSTRRALKYAISLPWDTSVKPVIVSASVAVEGDYLFVIERAGKIHVLDKATGLKRGAILAGAAIKNGAGEIDVPNGISVQRDRLGEYVIFVEEDTHAKLLVYRWKP